MVTVAMVAGNRVADTVVTGVYPVVYWQPTVVPQQGLASALPLAQVSHPLVGWSLDHPDPLESACPVGAHTDPCAAEATEVHRKSVPHVQVQATVEGMEDAGAIDHQLEIDSLCFLRDHGPHIGQGQ